MKKIKILLLLLTVAVGGFYSCTDNNPVENEVVTTKSISLRTTLNEIKKANNITGKNALATQDTAFCFNFVFPLTLAYNDGTVVTVASYDGLLEVLTNETSTLYIEGIEFPFQVQQGGAVVSIDSEEEFFALVQDCDDFHTLNSFFFDFTCYSLVYPISIIVSDDQGIIIHNQTELMDYLSTPAGSATELNIEFPISVIQNDQTIVINNLYEFFNLNNDCPSSSCICTADYSPVCVQTSAGIVEYSNMCHAECDGYTAADVVSCNPTQTFGQLLGSCFFIAYPAQVEDGGQLVTINNDGECLQYWNAAQPMPHFHYPITVTFAGAITTYTFASQAAFQNEIDTHCN